MRGLKIGVLVEGKAELLGAIAVMTKLNRAE